MHNSGHINGVNSAGYSLRENMAAYDKLPKAIRQALQESVFNWSAASITMGRRKLGAKRASIPYVVERIRSEDVRVVALNPPKL
jgi:hypothetical protein